MTERNKQFGNVAFGGNWSEEILITEELRRVLDVIEKGAHECADRDIQDEEFLGAMLYVRKNIEKGPMLCKAMFDALREENQGLRQRDVGRVCRSIREWAGL